MFSRQTICSLAQVLESLPRGVTSGLLYKHFADERDQYSPGLRGMIDALEQVVPEDLMPLMKEVVLNRNSMRAAAPTKYVFDERLSDLERWLLHDGWRAEGRELQRLGPDVGDVVEIQDRLAEALLASGLDRDAAIAESIAQSAATFAADPPDFNASGTHARIALETVVRRAAAKRADGRRELAPRDRWGDALAYLRSAGVFDEDEERSVAALYTFVSDAAHQPLNDEEWARLARTYCLSTCYYVVKKWEGQVGE